jgi:hypothetical protein
MKGEREGRMSKNGTFVQPITFKLDDCRFFPDHKLLLFFTICLNILCIQKKRKVDRVNQQYLFRFKSIFFFKNLTDVKVHDYNFFKYFISRDEGEGDIQATNIVQYLSFQKINQNISK